MFIVLSFYLFDDFIRKSIIRKTEEENYPYKEKYLIKGKQIEIKQ